MKLVLAMILAFLPLMAAAQDLSKALAAKVVRDPEKYLDDIKVIITGFGTEGAIDRAALQQVVAMERAEARAIAFRRLQDADLNGDGTIDGDEMGTKAAASAAVARGRLILHFGKADANGDNRVGAEELQIYANTVALEMFSARKEADIYAVMEFDKDGDARVTLPEVRAAIALTLSRKGQGDARKDKDT